jgi:glycosyltransferase involved in cell wall biosynthesis
MRSSNWVIQSTDVLVIEQTDLNRARPNGIDKVIEGLALFPAPISWVIFGVTSGKSVQRAQSLQISKNSNGHSMLFAPIRDVDKLRFLSWLPESLLLSLYLIKFRKKINPRIIHVHRVELAFVCRSIWPRVRIIQFIHNAEENLVGINSDSIWRYFPFIYRIFENYSRRISSKTLVFNKNEFEKLSSFISPVVRCQTWVNPNTFNCDFRQDSKLGGTQIEIVWIGRFESQKDPLLALEVSSELWKRNEDHRLRLIGSGSLESELRRKIDKLGLAGRVEVLYPVDSITLSRILQESDVCLMTSHYEGSPTVLIEALSCGTKPVITDGSDPDGVIQHGWNGLRSKSRDASELAELIQRSPSIESALVSLSGKERVKDKVIPLILKESVFDFLEE